VSRAAVKALLLAAGAGSRLRPLTDVLPKCLMPINGRPLLGLWLELLTRAGVETIVLNLHHHAGLVREYVRRSPYADRVALRYEPVLLGTAGTLRRNAGELAGGSVLLAHADNLTWFDFEAFVAAHRRRPAQAALTMMTFVTDAPGQCGIVETDGDGLVVGFHEKSANPPGNLANAAIYVLEPEVLLFVTARNATVTDFSTEVIPHFLGRAATFHNGRYHRDIGTLTSLLRAQIEYPLAVGSSWPAPAGDDPYYGLLRENGGRLAAAFDQALDSALAALRSVGSP